MGCETFAAALVLGSWLREALLSMHHEQSHSLLPPDPSTLSLAVGIVSLMERRGKATSRKFSSES